MSNCLQQHPSVQMEDTVMAPHYKVTLFKIESTHNNLRTPTIDGVCKELPEVGKELFMWGEGLEFGTRLVRTTPIKSLSRLGDTFLFETRNSTYALKIVDEYDDEAENPNLTASTGGR